MNKCYVDQKVSPKILKKNKYDVVIIGAGIGGLTCGCYLAKAGMKVLIVEQHHKPGGYCTSFKRKGFGFDATTHYLGSFRGKGVLREIYDELELGNNVEIIRFDPSNVVMVPEHKIHIRTNIDETISEFQENFKNEAEKIDEFFNFIWNSEFANLYLQLKNKTFQDLLDIYFKDNKLKSILGLFLLNIGLPPSKASALAVAVLYKEFVLDGGYYPKGGMQAFSNAFAEKFKAWGGEIMLGSKVEKIIIKSNNVEGVIINEDNFIHSTIVVSNCDATNTYFQLIGKEYLSEELIGKINHLEISPSAFIVYLGLNKNYSTILKNRCSWLCSSSKNLNTNKFFSDLDRQDRPYMEDSFLCSFPSSYDASLAPPDNEVVFLFIPAKMVNNNFWQENKYYLADELIKKAEYYIPDLSSSIVVREIATPMTLYRYTLNRNGASYGWASTLLQVDKSIMSPITFIKNLYLVGHWASLRIGPGGISTVAYCGKTVAKLIIKSLEFKSK